MRGAGGAGGSGSAGGRAARAAQAALADGWPQSLNVRRIIGGTMCVSDSTSRLEGGCGSSGCVSVARIASTNGWS